MKRLIIIFVFSIKSIGVFSQNDSLFSIVDETYTMQYMFPMPGPPYNLQSGYIIHYYVKGSLYYNDTLYQRINGTSQTFNNVSSYISKLDTGCTSPHGYISYINKRLYFKDSLEQQKSVLVYDFNLDVGDTFTFIATYNNPPSNIDTAIETLAVIQVDSIILLNGIYCKRITFEKPSFADSNIIWVENIGDSNYGFLILNYGAYYNNYFYPNYSCVRTPDTLIYGYESDVYINCHTGINDNISEDFKINNPATTQLILTLPESTANIAYYLYNIQGSLKQEGKTTNSQTEINVAGLPRGMYVLKVVTDKQIITKKVVLQ